MTVILTIVNNTDPTIEYVPADAWEVVDKPQVQGAWTGEAMFVNGSTLTATMGSACVIYTFSVNATGFEWWGWQRNNGGLYSVCFDCPYDNLSSGTDVDGFNATTNNLASPVLLYSNTSLSYGIHNLTISNVFDPRGTNRNGTNGAYGEMNVDRFVLITPSTPPPARPSPSPSSETSTFKAVPIIGGVIGGVIGALLVVTFIFLYRRFRSRSPKRGSSSGTDKQERGSSRSATSVTPFSLDQWDRNSGEAEPRPMRAIRTKSTISGESSSSALISESHSAVGPSFVLPPIPPLPSPLHFTPSLPSPAIPGASPRHTNDLSPSLPSPRSSSSRSPPPLRDGDAGPIPTEQLEDADLELALLPPDYDTATAGRRLQRPPQRGQRKRSAAADPRRIANP